MKRTKLLSVFAFSALTFGMLTSCGGAKETMTDKEIVDAVMKDSSILLDNKTNPMRPTTYPMAYNELTALTGGYLKATTSFTYLSDANLEHKVSISWKYEAAQWKATEYETYTELRPVTNDIAFNGTGDFTVTGTATYNGTTSSASYLIHVVNDKNYVTIKDMPTEGDVAVQGYVTGIIKDTDGNGSPYGVYVQDGEYALMIYKPSKSVTDTLKVGDAVEVLGEASSYNNVKQITGSGAVITKLSEGEIRENIAEPVIAELEDADVLSDKNHAATMYKMTGAKVISCSIDANEYNGKVTEKAYVTAVVRYKGQDITISSDRYNADYDDKQKFYDTLKEIMDSNGAKTLDYTGPIGTVNVYNGKENGNTVEKKIPGFTFIDSSFAKVNNNAYVPVSSVSVTGEKDAIRVGETTQLKANVIDLDSEEVTWSSSDDTKVTVDNTGKVTGIAAGKATITATSKANAEIKGTYTINVAEKMTLADVYTKKVGSLVEFDAIYTGDYKGDSQNSGFFVGDGDYGMYLYRADSSKIEGLKVGDHVNVLGEVDIYNGGFQIADADVKKVETSSAVTPTTLELKDNLTGVDGKDTGRKVSVTGTLKGEPQLDSYDNVTLTITLTDKSEVNLKADSRYVPGYQLEALKALKADSTVTVNGFVTFNVSKSETLPTDAKGLQIVALSVPGNEEEISATTTLTGDTLFPNNDGKGYKDFDGDHKVNGVTYTTSNLMKDNWLNSGKDSEGNGRGVYQFKAGTGKLTSKEDVTIKKLKIVATANPSNGYLANLSVKVGDTAIAMPSVADVNETGVASGYTTTNGAEFYNYTVEVNLDTAVTGALTITNDQKSEAGENITYYVVSIEFSAE